VDADAVIGADLRRLRGQRPEVSGAVLAGTDGLLIASDLPVTVATHLAALAAASFGLGQRFADALDQGVFREHVVRATAGCVVTYPAGRHALLTLVTGTTADLDGLHEEARGVARRAGAVFDAYRRGVCATPVPEVRGPLAVRTPMATLPEQLRTVRAGSWRRPPI
jgi:uncharacterized protein